MNKDLLFSRIESTRKKIGWVGTKEVVETNLQNGDKIVYLDGVYINVKDVVKLREWILNIELEKDEFFFYGTDLYLSKQDFVSSDLVADIAANRVIKFESGSGGSQYQVFSGIEIQKVSQDILGNSPYTLPAGMSYSTGLNQLEIILDGVILERNIHWVEVDSTTIQFLFDISSNWTLIFKKYLFNSEVVGTVGTKEVDESGIQDGKVLSYSSSLDKAQWKQLIYSFSFLSVTGGTKETINIPLISSVDLYESILNGDGITRRKSKIFDSGLLTASIYEDRVEIDFLQSGDYEVVLIGG